jgi:hypothetical protein
LHLRPIHRDCNALPARLGQIGDHQAMGSGAIHRQAHDGQPHQGRRGPAGRVQPELALATAHGSSGDQRLKALPVGLQHKPGDEVSHSPLKRLAEDGGKARVAIRDECTLVQRGDALAHCLHQDPVAALGALQREDALARRTSDHQRVHLAGTDRRQGLFGLV